MVFPPELYYFNYMYIMLWPLVIILTILGSILHLILMPYVSIGNMFVNNVDYVFPGFWTFFAFLVDYIGDFLYHVTKDDPPVKKRVHNPYE